MSAEKFLLAYLIIISLALFVTMGADKACAKAHRRRVPENTLFLLALVGGGAGGVLGMLAFRHKTRHIAFVLGFPLISIAEYGALLYFLVFR